MDKEFSYATSVATVKSTTVITPLKKTEVGFDNIPFSIDFQSYERENPLLSNSFRPYMRLSLALLLRA